jgi:hypothetical protein
VEKRRRMTRKADMLQVKDINQEFDLKYNSEKRKSNDFNRES